MVFIKYEWSCACMSVDVCTQGLKVRTFSYITCHKSLLIMTWHSYFRLLAMFCLRRFTSTSKQILANVSVCYFTFLIFLCDIKMVYVTPLMGTVAFLPLPKWTNSISKHTQPVKHCYNKILLFQTEGVG